MLSEVCTYALGAMLSVYHIAVLYQKPTVAACLHLEPIYSRNLNCLTFYTNTKGQGTVKDAY